MSDDRPEPPKTPPDADETVPRRVESRFVEARPTSPAAQPASAPAEPTVLEPTIVEIQPQPSDLPKAGAGSPTPAPSDQPAPERAAHPLRIAFVASEVAPFAKTGGLADVSSALPAALGRRGHDVRVFMPLYSSIDFGDHEPVPVDFLHHVPVPLGDTTFHFTAFTAKLPGTESGAESAHDSGRGGVDVYFIGCPALYDRPGVYTGEWDEHLRFALLQRAAVACCQRMGWAPHVVHANDWHTALLPLYLRTVYAWDRRLFARTKTVLTIHNIAYQGRFSKDVLHNLGLGAYADLLHQQHLDEGWLSFLETGCLYADAVTTVSGTYAREIQTPAFGEGLDPLLRERSSSVVGIVNGVDYDVWNPAVDPHIPRTYDVDSVAEGKEIARADLLKALGLYAAGPEVPVFGVVSRLTAQKGLELTFDAMTEALRYLDVRFVVLGSGQHDLEQRFHALQRRFPGKMVFYRGYNEPLAHRIEAGADMFLMPSRFEPCGLNQMYSLKYGTPPIVRKTGGLADTVEHWNPSTRRGTGFVFEHYDSQGFTWALRQALSAWRDQDGWAVLRRNGMLKDYSWQRQVKIYEALYARLLGLDRA